MKKSVIELESIVKKYGNKTVLNDLSLEIDKGINVILGPNGAGKTTLLNIILGLSSCDSGTIHIENAKVSIPYDIATKRKFLYIPDEPIVMGYLTGLENLSYISYIYGVSKTNQELLDILSEFGIDFAANTLTKDYSRGMKQRLCLSIMRISNPKIIVLDEPTIGLAIDGIHDLVKTIKKIQLEEKTFIITTHDLSFCRQLKGRNILLDKGHVEKLFDVDDNNDIEEQLLSFFNEKTSKSTIS